MTHQIRHFTLHPIGRGTLHTDATCTDARQESLRQWAAARRSIRGSTTADAMPALTKRPSAPRR